MGDYRRVNSKIFEGPLLVALAVGEAAAQDLVDKLNQVEDQVDANDG